jgi:hypothetical protein
MDEFNCNKWNKWISYGLIHLGPDIIWF